MRTLRRLCLPHFALMLGLLAAPAAAAIDGIGIALEGYRYPHSVQYLELTMEGEPARLAYMDVAPASNDGGAPVAVLLHGRNFFGAYWAETIKVLRRAGYRVIVPDQIGFGKSSKPDVPHSLHAHAANLQQLLQTLGVARADVIGHSLGGMMAVRFALSHPEMVRRLVLEAPIGLEDYRLKVPYATREELAREHLQTPPEGFDRLFRAFVAQWDPRFQTYSDVQAGWLRSAEAHRIARTAAHTYTMAYEQPVVYELPLVKAPTLLMVGELDRAAIGRNRVPQAVRATMGLMPALARQAVAALPDAKLVLFPQVGHVPHLEVPDRFHAEVLEFLR